MGSGPSVKRSILVGALLAVLLVGSLVGWAVWQRSYVPYESARRVLLIVAWPGEDGTVGARVVQVLSIEDGEVLVEPVDAATRVVVPGTNYDTLFDTYAFGGGVAVSRAVREIRRDEARLPFLVIDDELWRSLVPSKSVEVDLRESVDVFTGTRLHTFEAGTVALDGEGICLLLNGADYFADADRAAVLRQVAPIVGQAVAANGSALKEWLASGAARSDLGRAAGSLGEELESRSARVRVVP